MAVDFNGTSDKITVVDAAELRSTSSGLSVFFWVYKDANESFSGYVQKWRPGNADWFIGEHVTPKFYVSIAANGGVNANRVSNATGISAGAWHYVGFTYDGGLIGSGIHVYVDGVNVDGTSGGSMTAIKAGVSDIDIGQDPDDNNYYDGKMSNIFILNREMTVAEIRSTMYRRWIPESSTVLCLNLDEGADNLAPGGVDCADISSYGNHGTFVSGPTWTDGPPIKILHE